MSFKNNVKRLVPDSLLEKYYAFQLDRRLPDSARRQDRLDRRGPPSEDPGCQAAISVILAWLCRAQDFSATGDGGVARQFCYLNGWGDSYPETTGYIVPTFLSEAEIQADDSLYRRAERMLDWLVAIQLPQGAFQGGLVTHRPVVPVTFNTGQILLGLAAGAGTSGKEEYLSAMHRAASWLVETQDADGAWRRFPTPFAAPGEKVYETHVSWGLFEAERVAPGNGYGDAGLRQVRWALSKQAPNGWFQDCCLDAPQRPLTHTIAYALRGVLEAYRLCEDRIFLDAGIRTADSLVECVRDDGFLSGRFDSQWRPMAAWDCLTGAAQLAFCWFQLYRWTGNPRYLEAGCRVNSYVRRTIRTEGDPDLVGGVGGSFPISGDYGRYQYLNWAAKFCIDAFRQELAVART